MTELYHIGFGQDDLGDDAPTVALLSGDPGRAEAIAYGHLQGSRTLSTHRGLHSYLARTEKGVPLLSATSGMGAPSLSIVVNELFQVGIRTIIRVGTCGSIQPFVNVGSVVVSSGALCTQGAARDVAPTAYPAVADPFLTVELAGVAAALGVEHHVGLTASVDTFYEGQGRTGGANKALLPELRERLGLYRALNILNFEMEAGTLFKMGSVYGFRAACVCGVVAQRTEAEAVVLDAKDVAVENAVRVAVGWCEGQKSG